jgi:omega-6 fatty acid desaturase (delta-12 desaturase)
VTTENTGDPAAGLEQGGVPQRMRSGRELILATLPFQAERRLTSWLLLLSTFVALGAALYAVMVLPWWPLKVLAGMITGLIQVRLFIFYHDALHGSIFRRSWLARAIMMGVGCYLVTPGRVWRESHDFHHQNNAKMMGSSIGSFPMISTEGARQASRRKLWLYRLSRHPITIGAGYGTIFLYGMVIGPFLRDPGTYWRGLVAGLSHITLLALVTWHWGWMAAVAGVLVPSVVATAVGSYLFYAQHNFPTMKLRRREDWMFTDAALESSSMFDMGWLMHWFTGNIGYHHVHHLNHLVPFYRLPEAMRAIPELQQPSRTSWRMRDIAACFDLDLWDHTHGRMMRHAEVAAAL